MRFLPLLLLLLSSLLHAQIHSVESIKELIRNRNIRTMEEFISELPDDILTNYTLMHDSKSLHGSSFAQPRALLFGENGQWIVSFNGSTTQAAGSMVEMMIYNPLDKTYAFHELDFSDATPVLKENPAKCLACHGSNPRPIWDHYNAWPGAYGDVDDRYTEEEYKYLTAFIEKAPTHPRYKYLKKLKEGYTLSRPGMRDGLTERTMKNRNRDLNLVLYQQKMKDVAAEMAAHPKFPKMKGLMLYYLSKCYVDPKSNYQGDGPDYSDPDSVIAPILKTISHGKHPNLASPFLPDQFLDYLFTRLDVDTNSWYMNSRTHATYKNLRDGSDRQHESWLNYLLAHVPEYKDHFKYVDLDYQVMKIRQASLKDKNSCAEFLTMAPEGIKSLGTPMPPVNTPLQTMRGERVCQGTPRKCETFYRNLPQICLQCHAQTTSPGKIVIPFHEFPEMIKRGQTQLPEKMLRYVSARVMPIRATGDTAAYKQYAENDFPKLKKYIEDLLKKPRP